MPIGAWCTLVHGAHSMHGAHSVLGAPPWLAAVPGVAAIVAIAAVDRQTRRTVGRVLDPGKNAKVAAATTTDK